MKSRVTVWNSPLHVVMIVFPVSLWVASFVCDLVFLRVTDPVWEVMAFWSMLFGWVGGILAAIPGVIDYFTVTPEGGRPGRYGALHGLINAGLLMLYALNLGLRWNGVASEGEFWSTFALSSLAIALLLASGWLGLQVAHVYGSSVEGISHLRGRAPERERPEDEERRAA